jgi:hypothetical protein
MSGYASYFWAKLFKERGMRGYLLDSGLDTWILGWIRGFYIWGEWAEGKCRSFGEVPRDEPARDFAQDDNLGRWVRRQEQKQPPIPAG